MWEAFVNGSSEAYLRALTIGNFEPETNSLEAGEKIKILRIFLSNTSSHELVSFDIILISREHVNTHANHTSNIHLDIIVCVELLC